jgi:hypothetical protein
VASSAADLRQLLADNGITTVLIGAHAANRYRLEVRHTVDVDFLASSLAGAADVLRSAGCTVREVSEDGETYLLSARLSTTISRKPAGNEASMAPLSTPVASVSPLAGITDWRHSPTSTCRLGSTGHSPVRSFVSATAASEHAHPFPERDRPSVLLAPSLAWFPPSRRRNSELCLLPTSLPDRRRTSISSEYPRSSTSVSNPECLPP